MAASGIDGTPTGNPSTNKDVFAAQRSENNGLPPYLPFPRSRLAHATADPFAGDHVKLEKAAGGDELHSPTQNDRRRSREWDASKVPPSQFQRPKGSIYSTPNSRDGHVKGSERDQAYWDKLKEKGWIDTGSKN
ncbi:hypothetical protein N0V90_003713 [Kalmusia sp. IMI 367209]|nr:hypothetical protein N0V90_003713 [Kalmusia sp. IMI 367209]